jgi:hypothetical protein
MVEEVESHSEKEEPLSEAQAMGLILVLQRVRNTFSYALNLLNGRTRGFSLLESIVKDALDLSMMTTRPGYNDKSNDLTAII